MKPSVMLSQQIQEKLKRLGIAAVYVFGSYAQGVNSKLSDIDVAVLMTDATTVSHTVSTHALYQSLYTILEPVLADYASELDIVFLQRASLELQAHVIYQGKVLFETDPRIRLDFEEKTMLFYADFAPLRYEFDQAVLAKI